MCLLPRATLHSDSEQLYIEEGGFTQEWVAKIERELSVFTSKAHLAQCSCCMVWFREGRGYVHSVYQDIV